MTSSFEELAADYYKNIIPLLNQLALYSTTSEKVIKIVNEDSKKLLDAPFEYQQALLLNVASKLRDLLNAYCSIISHYDEIIDDFEKWVTKKVN